MQSLRSLLKPKLPKLVTPQPLSSYVSRIRYLMKLKEDDEACREALKSGSLLLYHKLAPLLQKKEKGIYQLPRLRTPDVKRILEKLGRDKKLISEAVLISCPETAEPCFCLDVGDLQKNSMEQLCGGVFMDLRTAFLMLTVPETTLVAKGQALLRWHQTHGFCSATGQPTVRNQSGSQRVSPNSGITYYPQMAPVVIVLVSDGNRCLLGRQRSFPPGMYSALAGFCDLGETLEETLRREVAEEVGLEVDTLQYSASQHWPIPQSSFMLACHATVNPDKTQVVLNKAELEDARWCSLEEVLAALQVKYPPNKPGATPPGFWVPHGFAIAHRLIQEWADQQQHLEKK
ncbi:nucleoside diphosphate-linked moiety X motif 13 isoform X2 [Pygocentrus nattereri]|uniref:NAD(+) diphosphatase n=2 Tax=Pygocentrus nattereri TaxID=42514 RepID=A0A3B4D6U4_PYGNA|nr:nucleoside diphosphate-linked moiety X motif 13 isoform X2 [Pygocentrus nattereri]XP_017566065.1 nucleoside diphosphate-linked moiety X motif 13 isoform X2 [Pygocentrus nattereri]XP_017566066.1 nucleoside diphosphate-linked moiety X motif 13 isoform X2 [Pygocentrus nattereri]